MLSKILSITDWPMIARSPKEPKETSNDMHNKKRLSFWLCPALKSITREALAEHSFLGLNQRTTREAQSRRLILRGKMLIGKPELSGWSPSIGEWSTAGY